MTSKFYIDWKCHHVLKKDKHMQLSEYCSYNLSDEEYIYVYHIPNGYISSITSILTDSINEKFIFTCGLKLYYFDGQKLQCGSNEIYHLQKVTENVLFCNQFFLIVDESTLYRLEIYEMDKLLNEMSHYYSVTELIFLHAKSCTKLYKWRSLYDKVITVQMNEKSNTMKIWMNADIKDILILNPLNHF